MSATKFSLSTGKNGYGDAASEAAPRMRVGLPSGLDFTATCVGPEHKSAANPKFSHGLAGR